MKYYFDSTIIRLIMSEEDEETFDRAIACWFVQVFAPLS